VSANGSRFSFVGDVGTVVVALERPEVIGSKAESAGETAVEDVADEAGERPRFMAGDLAMARGIVRVGNA
jgi:hypothetical protein